MLVCTNCQKWIRLSTSQDVSREFDHFSTSSILEKGFRNSHFSRHGPTIIQKLSSKSTHFVSNTFKTSAKLWPSFNLFAHFVNKLIRKIFSRKTSQNLFAIFFEYLSATHRKRINPQGYVVNNEPDSYFVTLLCKLSPISSIQWKSAGGDKRCSACLRSALKHRVFYCRE